MTTSFVYDALPGRVVFGPGSRHRLGDEAARLGSERIVVVGATSEDGLASELSSILGDRVVGRFSDVVQHVPVGKARAATTLVRDLAADTVLTIGGGSATGLGKAIALERDVIQIAVPTTYAGSEMTAIWGLTDGDHKQTGSDLRVKPEVVVYDPELTLTLPAHVAGPSGMNALAHAVEALYGPGANPVISAIAVESIRALAVGLPVVTARPGDLAGRTDALYGAYLAGTALANGGTGLHHKICHILGGMFNLNHGDMNAVVLPHALAYNAPVIPDVMIRVARALEVADPAQGLFDLAVAIGAPTSLEAIGMPEAGLDDASRRIVEEASGNVRPPALAAIRQMLDDAYRGQPPAPHR